MDDEGDYQVYRSPLRYEYHTKVCLAMKVDVASSADELYHVVLERSRMVLFECSDHVLVSPQSDHFLLICDPAYPEADQFKQMARKISVVEAWSSPVTSQVLAECLTYSFSAMLAPEWNWVGGWLLEGSKFLHQAEPLDAVRMRINVANERVEVSVKATKVDFPLISPEDLGVGEDLLERFLQADPGSVLTQRDLGERTLHVLPRLNRAKLMSISKVIPPCPQARLTSWASMKRFWQNLHGYRLGVEETDEPQVFYNLEFWNGLTFTYPEWTVRLSDPRPVPGTDPQPILDHFMKDLLTFNKIVLGLQFCLVPVEPLVTPSYGQEEEEEPPAPTVPYRKEQQEPEFHSSRAAARGLSSLADFTENQRRKVEPAVEQHGRSEARPRVPRTSTVTTLPMTANRMKPSFMMNVATTDKKNQLKPSRPKTKFTRKIIPNYNPFAAENDPEMKASIAREQAKAEAQWELSQKLLMELMTGKEDKKSKKVDLEFLTF